MKQPQVVLLALLVAAQAHARLPIEALQREIQLRHVHTSQAADIGGNKVFLVKQPRNEAHRLVWASTTCSKVPPAYPPDFFYGSTLLPEEEVFLTQDVLDKLDGSQLWTYYLLPGVEHQYSPIDRPDFLDTPCTTNNCEAQFEAAQAFVASLNTVRSHPSIATAGGPLWHYIYELPALATQLEIHVTNYVKLLDEAYGGAGFGRFPSSEYYPHPMFTGFLWEYYEWESAQDWVDYCTYFGVECDEPTPGARYYTQVVYHQSIAFSQPDFDDATIRSLGADVFIHIDAIDAEACRPSGFAPEDMGRLLFFAHVNRGEQSGWIETSRPDVPTLPRSVELGGHQGLGWSLYTNASYTVVTLDYRPLPDTGDSCMGCEDQPGGAHSDLASMHVTIGLGRDAIHPSVGVLELGARDAQEGIAALSRVRFHAVSDSAQAVLTNDRLDSVTAPQCHVRFTELPAPNAEHGFVAHFHMRSAESDPFESESRRALVVVQGMEDESIAEAWAAGDFSNPGEYWDDSVHIYEMCYGAVAKHTVFGIPYSTRPSPGTATAPPAADQHRLLVKRTTDTVPRLFSTDPPGLELPAVVKSASAAQTTESSDDTSFWVVSVGNAHGTFSQSYRREVSGETLNILRTKEDHSQAAEITEEIHTNMAWGWALVRSTSSPWDNPVWTEYTYYTNSTDHGYAQLNSILQSDGYWERYEYDAQGNLHKRIIPFGDAPPDAKEHLCRVRTTTTSHAGEELTTLEVEEVLGAEVARSYTIRSPRQTRHIQCASPGAGPAAPGNLVTTTTYEQDPRNPSPLTGLRVARIEHPDGTLTIKSYPDDGTEIVRHGEADATRTDVVDGRLTEVHRNDLGHVMSRQVIDIASGLLIESEVATDVDETGRPIAWSHLDGTTRRIDPGCCCGTESETARDGSTRFFTHDAEGRPVATRYSNAHGGTVIERTFYDGAGRATLRGYSDVAGMALQPGDTEFHAHFFPTERTGYDAAGRTRWTENSVGGRTVHDLPQTLGRHQMLATILPGGGTVEEEYQLDGQLFRRTGTAAPHLQMAYGVEGGELFAQTIHLGDRGETTLWSKTFTDFLGRPYRTVYSDGSFEQTWFNEKGQEVRSVDRDGIETLHAYNGKGESQVVALDENRNGVMDYAGRDRITRTTARVVSAHGTTVRRTTVETWDQDGSDASWTSLVQDVSVDGLRIWTRTDGLETQTTTAYEPEAARRTDTTTHPDMTRLVTTTVNGQMSRQDWTDQQGQLLRRIDYDYGAFGDLVRQADTQAGIVEQVYATPHLMTSRVRRNRIDSNDVLAVSYGYDESLRLVATTNADQSVTRCEFGPDGQIRRCHGAGIHPLEYEYDVQGRLVALRTWQDFAAGSGAATTRWVHDPLSGHLARKEYEGGKGVDYAHTPGGRIKTRTWARGVTTAYGYDTLGQLTNVHHGTSDTPDTTYTYDRLGRLRSASSGHATNTYEYAGNLLVRETVAIEGLTHTLTHEYDALNRPAGHAGDTVPRLDYGYDHAGRLASVAFLGLTNTYLFGENGWPAESGVAGHLTVTRVYDGYDRLVAVSNSSPTATLPGFDYGHDLLGRRTKQGMARRDDGRELVWNYAYDAIGQLTGAWQVADGVDVPGRRYGYAYDDIGNRTRTSRSGGSPAPGHEGAADVVSTYTVNPLNQYVARTVPSSAEISGTARADAILSFENVHTGRRMRALRNGSWFHVDMPLGDNAMGTVTDLVRMIAVLPGQAPDGVDLIATNQTVTLTAMQTPQVFSHDDDGNLLSDGQFTYTWDAENRLTGASNESALVRNWYDHIGRRVRHAVSGLSTSIYLYDGWNLIAEVRNDRGVTTTNHFVWGLDLSATLQGAGGVGGLLATVRNGTPLLACADGNGNVVNLVNATDGSVVATYEYDPFGEVLRATGPAAQSNPWRFSTRYTDPETGLVMYPARPYSSTLGRFPSRDPIEEGGGENLYAFVGNSPLDFADPWGLALYAFDGTWNDRAKMKRPTNVAKLAAVYQGNVWYEKGVGTTWYTGPIGGATGAGGGSRVERMYRKLTEYFNTHDSTHENQQVDVIGFSRGAALARTFVNYINSKGGVPLAGPDGRPTGVICPVKIRFLGLFDTVASFGWPGNRVNWGQHLEIPANVLNVRHAIAMDEKRGMFPLSSVLSDPSNPFADPRIVETGFRGAHSDVGGGYDDGDRSNFALMWMHDEGVSVGVPFGPLAPEDIGAINPIIHDGRGRWERWRDHPRSIYYPNAER